MENGKRESFSIQILQLIDAALIWLSFMLAAIARDPFREFVGLRSMNEHQGGLGELTWVLFILVPILPFTLEIFGFYRNPLRKRVSASLLQILQAYVIVCMFVGLFVIFLKISVESRWILGAGVPLTVIALLLREAATKSIVLHAVRAEDAKEAVIIAGGEREIEEFLATTSEEVQATWKIVDQVDLRDTSIQDFEEKIKAASVGRVFFLARHTEFGQLAKAIEVCELQGIEAWVSAGFIRTQIARPDFDLLGGKPMLVLRSTPELSWALFAKTVIDKVGALMIIIGTFPLWVVAAIGIKIASPSGPIFFKQQRAGRYGKPFKMYKFRTMSPDAEARLAKVKEEVGNQMSGPVFKLDKDPRIFAFGSWLRKTSVDEFPQLINVLKGDMSLVGPRPLPLYEVDMFECMEHRRRLSVRPGITCTWQAGGRNQITKFDDWVKMDLDYIDNWSLLQDFKIMLKTIPAVLCSKGAK
ncbi:sugar transferase [Roseibacillus persicicus]|uniref:sugar transferase n=1 Tax=Roseibacillus persicicus TaxID=454148 RepID=UPI0028104D55|nr:sugar transferase [Roseibacillus persicicus]MDQ8188873.1 sugar transferase [Roseibacillus persicicus]